MEKIIIKDFESKVKAVEGERALDVTISTNDIDRSGDIVEPKGAKLTNFKKNPVVLMAHDYLGLPIGKATDLVKTDTGITAKVIFPEEGTYPLADTVYNMYKQKFLKAWSIGFIPITSEKMKDENGEEIDDWCGGRRFKTWELLEFSACSVPNNPNALSNMVSKGIDVGLLKEEGLITIVEGKDIEKVEDPKDIKVKVEGETEEVIIEGTNEKDEDIKEIIKVALKDAEIIPIDPEKVIASIEGEEGETLTEVKEFNINEIYEVVKENKELKEKIAALELKAGAVLNTKNKSNLKDAQELIQSVLDSAGKEESIDDEGGESKDTKKDDTVITITEDKIADAGKDEKTDEKTITVNEKVIAEAVSKALKYQMGIVSK